MNKQVLFILATHGDEGFAIDILKKLEKIMPREKYGYDWVIGNEKALTKGVRSTEADLNRSAPGTVRSSIYEERRSVEIIRLANTYDFVIDIHGTVSNSGIFIIIPKPSYQNIVFTAMLPVERIILWYSKQSLINGPIVQFCKPSALEIECGPKNDYKTSASLERILINFLRILNSLDYRKLIKNMKRKEFFAVYGYQKEWNQNLRDFQPIKTKGEQFIPLLVTQYKGIACYKMKKISFPDLFIY